MNDLDPKSVAMTKTVVIHERFPYRYVQKGYIQLNGKPDLRLQKADGYSKKYSDIYLFDNADQCFLAIEDFEYSKWLDPDGVPCYVRDSVSSENQTWWSHYDPFMSLRHLSNAVGAGGVTTVQFLTSGQRVSGVHGKTLWGELHKLSFFSII